MIIEAPDGTTRLILRDDLVPEQGTVTMDQLYFTVILDEKLVEWCEEQGMETPSLCFPDPEISTEQFCFNEESDFERFVPCLKFSSDEEAVMFKLKWQKGCDSI